MDIRFDGKVVAVTGGGSGIGRESARLFAASGARVFLGDINEAGGHETVQMIEDAGGTAVFTVCDVTDDAQVRDFIDFGVRTYGRLDCAVNASGIAPSGTIEQTEPAVFDRTLKVNLYGLYHAMRHEVPAMRASGGGAIVNICSDNSLTVTASGTAYGTSKWGALGLTKAVGLELADQGIRVNSVGPGITDTAMIAGLRIAAPEVIDKIIEGVPDKRMGRADEPAFAALFLCSEFAAHITCEQITVDGGQFVRL
jgi:NAD(P)-dependent dehydrogenase (short-subunit alcohol dehydrogenase family)